jgi:hypothetical protein
MPEKNERPEINERRGCDSRWAMRSTLFSTENVRRSRSRWPSTNDLTHRHPCDGTPATDRWPHASWDNGGGIEGSDSESA